MQVETGPCCKQTSAPLQSRTSAGTLPACSTQETGGMLVETGRYCTQTGGGLGKLRQHDHDLLAAPCDTRECRYAGGNRHVLQAGKSTVLGQTTRVLRDLLAAHRRHEACNDLRRASAAREQAASPWHQPMHHFKLYGRQLTRVPQPASAASWRTSTKAAAR